MTTEIPSGTPLKNNATTDNQKLVDNPKTIIQTPNPKTANNNFLPAFCCNGIEVEINMVIKPPIAGAALKIPKPSEPTFKISCAKMGNKARSEERRVGKEC